ncbi:MAG: restriction endonuclease subunit S, partial [Bacteroidia bacterium]|nr:restriction endonuclease subunit S [Bacteroidia bacterium]
KTSILLLDKTLAKKTEKILFVKIENDGYSLGAQRKELSTSDLPDATNFIKQYITAIRNNDFSLIDFEHLPLNSIAVERSRITENGDYNLSGDRYKDSIAKKQSKFDLVELSEVCDLYQPQTISASDFKENGEYKVFGANGVIGYYDKYNHEDSEVLITCRGATCGTINFSEPKSWITGNAMVAKPIDNRINKRFLFHLLKVSDLSSVITGAAQPQITRASLSPFKIPLPPVTVQLEIETKIEQYEKIVAGANQVVENYKPQIDIKPEWEMVELGSVCDFSQGIQVDLELQSKEYIDGYDVFLRIENYTQYSDDFRYIPKELSKNKYIRKDEVVVVRYGASAGYVGRGFDGVVANNLFKVSPNEKITNDFLYFYLTSEYVQSYFKRITAGGAMPALSFKTVEVVQIPIIPIEEQNLIVSQIEKEQQLVKANKELIKIYEQKIKDEINKLWEE